MSLRKLLDSLANLDKAVSNLEIALTLDRNAPLVIEGTIHRFEIAIELTWKTVKRALEHEGLQAKTPRETLTTAFQSGWLQDERVWLEMLTLRNTTAHLYLHEELAQGNFDALFRIAPVLRANVDFLQQRYRDQG